MRRLPIRLLVPFAALAVVPVAGCATLMSSDRDRAIDACREQAQAEGWSLRSVEGVRREGTAQRVEMRAYKLLLGTQTLVCYFDPRQGTATIN